MTLRRRLRLGPAGGVIPRGVRSRLGGYDPPVLPTCPAALRVSAGGAVVHGNSESRGFAERGAAGLDVGMAFGGRLAAHGERRTLRTDCGPETRMPVRALGRSAGEIER